MAANDINTNIDVQASSTPDVSMITYNEVLALIYRTLIERPEGHEIQPEEHQVMATAILNYARTLQVLGSSIFQGFATLTTYVPQVTTSGLPFWSRKLLNVVDVPFEQTEI